MLSSDSSVSDYCRLCATSFKVKFGSNLGKQGHSSQKICSGHHNKRSALRLCKPKVEKKLDCSLFISCNILIGSVTQCGRNIHNLGQFYQFIKAVITSTASDPVKSSKHTHYTLDKARPAWRKSKSIRVNSRAAKSPSIEGSTSATKGKSRKSLSFSLLEKIKKPKSL